MNVVQNIWYLFGLSDTRCSVWRTDRPQAVRVGRGPGTDDRPDGIRWNRGLANRNGRVRRNALTT